MPGYQVRKAGPPEQACCTGEQNRGLERQFRVHPAGIPVCIFAKLPVPGRVKTRLATAMGSQAAAELAPAMLQDVWSVVANTPRAMPVLAAAEPGDFDIDVPNDRLWLQHCTDLGSRIESILRRGLEIASSAIALGADSPLVTMGDLAQAIEELAFGNAVLGPCDDGGFYLMGLNSCPAGVLAAIPWSCQVTCEAAESQLRSSGMKVSRIRTGFDVDTLADIWRLRRELDCVPPEVAPRTRRWLDEVA
jgi:uncharacterized protein